MNFTRRNWVLGVLATVVLSAVPALEAADGQDSPEQIILSTSGQLKTLLREDSERLNRDPAFVYRMADEIFLPHIDLNRISSLVLGRHWRRASAPQKAAFSSEFKRLLVRTYATALRELGDWDIELGQTRMDTERNNALVQTRVIRSGAQPLSVDYRMHRKADRWLAYDVKIEGISLITNYRANFDRTVRQQGLDRLIEELTHKNNASQGPADPRIAVNGLAGK
jgi:phospholipid transport system substrate-binding protein